MRAVIVGHGPSLLGAKRGEEIDSFDAVVRMKAFTRFWNEEDYGNKLDYLVSSTEAAMANLANHIKPKEYWLYPKKGTYDKRSINHLYSGLPAKVLLTEADIWNERFRQRSGYDAKKDPIRGRNVSTGFAALVYTADQLYNKQKSEERELYLIGFDTLKDPNVEYESTFNPGTVHKGFHDWHIEHSMLEMVEAHYNVKLRFV
jgi:hypothetical protein